MPDFAQYAVDVPAAGSDDAEATRVQGQLVRDVIALNAEHAQLPRLQPRRDGVEPLDAVFEVTSRTSVAEIVPTTTTCRPTAA